MKVVAAAIVVFSGMLSLGLAGIAATVGQRDSSIVTMNVVLGVIVLIAGGLLFADAWNTQGFRARISAPALAELLRDSKCWAAAAEALGRMGPAAIPALTEWLQSTEREFRLVAAQVLGNMGRQAEPAIPALTDALHDTNRRVRKAAAEALEKIKKEK